MADAPSGLGDDDFPGFPADVCPEELIDLTGHHSTLADVLREDPSLYRRLRTRRTSLGVGLARCIKVGMDNRGHRLVKTPGIVAGDAECYDVFRELFDPVFARHSDLTAAGRWSGRHPVDPTWREVDLTTPCMDSREYVLSVQVRASRNVRGYRFPPAMSIEEREEVEGLLTQALSELRAPAGEYFPLSGSESYAERPGGMDDEEEASLYDAGVLFEAPDSSLRLCTGVGRHWPHGRGVFTNNERTLVAWVNEAEHLRLSVKRQDGAVELALRDLAEAFESISSALSRRGVDASGPGGAFAWSERLGFLTSSPVNLGTALQLSATVRLPCLAKDTASNWRSWCSQRRVQVRSTFNERLQEQPGVFELSNMDRLGISEAETLTSVVAAMEHVVHLERQLEAVQKARSGLVMGLASGRLPAALKLLGDELDERRLAANKAKMAAESEAAAHDDRRIYECARESAAMAVARAVSRSLRPPAEASPLHELDEEEEEEEAGVEVPIENLRGRLRDRLFEVLDDGQLEGLMQESFGRAPLRETEEFERLGALKEFERLGALKEHVVPDVVGIPCSVDATRSEVAGILQQAMDSGSLEEAVGSFSSESKGQETSSRHLQWHDDLEATRSEIADILKSSLDSGALQDAMEALNPAPVREEKVVKLPPQKPPLEKPQTTKSRRQMGQVLRRSYKSRELQAAVDDMEASSAEGTAAASNAAAPDDSRPAVASTMAVDVAQPAATAGVSLAAAPAQGVAHAEAHAAESVREMLQRLSGQNQRLGELTGLVQAMWQRIAEREAACKQLEETIAKTKVDVSHLDLNIEWHRQALKDAEGRSCELEGLQRKLTGTITFQQSDDFKDFKGGFGTMSARSEISTAADSTVATSPAATSLSGFRPCLEPLAPPLAPRC